MPKRRRDEEEIEFLAKRLKSLRRSVRRQRRSSSSSHSESECSLYGSSSSAEAADQRGRDSRNRNVLPSGQRVKPTPATARSAEATLPPLEGEPIVGTPKEVPAIPAPPTIPEATNIQEGENDSAFQAEMVEILGTDPSQAQVFGEDINKEVARRLEYVALSGLEKETRQELLEKFIVPANCQKIAAPTLNAEMRSTLGDSGMKRDLAIEVKQKWVAAAITGIARIITQQLKLKNNDGSVSRQLMEVGRLLCDVQHNDSMARRKYAMYALKKEFRDQVANTSIDKYLFGEDLNETLKTAKAVSRSSTDIKFQERPKHSTPKAKNWKSGASARSQPKAPARKSPSAAAINRRYGHGSSSHKSSHRGRPTRRR